MSTKGVCLYGYYGQGNLGDDLLMDSAIRLIRSVRPDAPILIHCHDAARVPPVANGIEALPLNAILADEARPRPRRLIAYFAGLRDAFKRADALIFGGGTVLQERGSPMMLLIILAMLLLAKRMGLRILLLGSGLGTPRSRIGRLALGAILKRTDLISLRDEASVRLCQHLAPRSAPRLTADLVYALPPPHDQTHREDRAILSIQPAVALAADLTGQAVRAALRDTITAFLKRGWTVSLLAFETKAAGNSGLDDRDAWETVAGPLMAEHPDRLGILALEGDLGTVTATMASARLHIGQRYHGHVLAAVSGVSFVGIAHDIKIEEVCRTFGMPCLSAGDVTTEALLASATKAETHPVDPVTLGALRTAALSHEVLLREALT